MSDIDRGDLQTIANGLFPAGFKAAALTPEGRDEVKEAVDVILRLSSTQNARLTLALEQLDKAADDNTRLRTALAEAEREIERQKAELSFAGNLAKGNIARAERAEAALAAKDKSILDWVMRYQAQQDDLATAREALEPFAVLGDKASGNGKFTLVDVALLKAARTAPQGHRRTEEGT